MDAIWKEMYEAARSVRNGRAISDYVEAGGVAAAILSESGKIYTGVCVETGAPCGACRELMTQLMPGEYTNIQIMLDYENEKTITLGELTPWWWI